MTSEFKETAESLNPAGDVQEKLSPAEQVAQYLRFLHQWSLRHDSDLLQLECSCQEWRATSARTLEARKAAIRLHEEHVLEAITTRGPDLTRQLEACERILGGPNGRELFDRIRALPYPTSNGEPSEPMERPGDAGPIELPDVTTQ